MLGWGGPGKKAWGGGGGSPFCESSACGGCGGLGGSESATNKLRMAIWGTESHPNLLSPPEAYKDLRRMTMIASNYLQEKSNGLRSSMEEPVPKPKTVHLLLFGLSYFQLQGTSSEMDPFLRGGQRLQQGADFLLRLLSTSVRRHGNRNGNRKEPRAPHMKLGHPLKRS